MTSRSGASLSGNGGRSEAATSRGVGKPSMSKKQIDAYLISREALRAMRRAQAAIARREPGCGGS